MSLSQLVSIFTRQHHACHALFGEALEARCQLSANPLVNATIELDTVETHDHCVFSQVFGASDRQLPKSLLATEVFVDAASTQLAPDADIFPTNEPIATEPAVGVGEAILDDVPTQPLIAVQPDEGVDPFVDCPGLDPRFCLPMDVDFDFDLDFLDGLIFDTGTHLTDFIFDAEHQSREHDLLFPGDQQFRGQ